MKPAPDPDAAWHDEEDEVAQVDLGRDRKSKRLRLTKQESRLSGAEFLARMRRLGSFRPKWSVTREDHQDSSLSARHSPLSIVKEREGGIPSLIQPDILNIRKLPDINAGHAIAGPITALRFHPSEPWILASGRDQQVFVFSAHQPGNRVLFSLKVPGLKIVDACFVDSGRKALLLGKEDQLAIWSILEGKVERFTFPGHRDQRWASVTPSPCGQYLALSGEGPRVAVFDACSMLLRVTLKTGSRSVVSAFSGDGAFLFAAGSESRVYAWDTRQFSCLKVFHDDAGIQVTCLASSSNGQFLAVGADTGCLNLYELSTIFDCAKSRVPPVKTFDNLTTKITSVEFHPSSELLVFGSADKYGALRIVHLSSRRVYRNWPREKTPIFHPHRICFDRQGATLAVGNEKGSVTSHGLAHYTTLVSPSS